MQTDLLLESFDFSGELLELLSKHSFVDLFLLGNSSDYADHRLGLKWILTNFIHRCRGCRVRRKTVGRFIIDLQRSIFSREFIISILFQKRLGMQFSAQSFQVCWSIHERNVLCSWHVSNEWFWFRRWSSRFLIIESESLWLFNWGEKKLKRWAWNQRKFVVLRRFFKINSSFLQSLKNLIDEDS